MASRETKRLTRSIVQKAEAIETSKQILGSSGPDAVAVFDAALALIDMHIIRLNVLKTKKAKQESK